MILGCRPWLAPYLLRRSGMPEKQPPACPGSSRTSLPNTTNSPKRPNHHACDFFDNNHGDAIRSELSLSPRADTVRTATVGRLP